MVKMQIKRPGAQILALRVFLRKRCNMAFRVLGVELRFDDGAKLAWILASERHFVLMLAEFQRDRQSIAVGLM